MRLLVPEGWTDEQAFDAAQSCGASCYTRGVPPRYAGQYTEADLPVEHNDPPPPPPPPADVVIPEALYDDLQAERHDTGSSSTHDTRDATAETIRAAVEGA